MASCMDECKMPAVKGPCKRFVQRVYFNHNTQKCEPFFYGGCLGNQNNFENVEACEQKCLPAPAHNLPQAPRQRDANCPVCRQSIGSSFCSADFAITVHTPTFVEDYMEEHKMVATVRRVLKAQTGTAAVLSNNQEVTIYMRDESTCPCPNLKRLINRQKIIKLPLTSRRKSNTATDIIILGKMDGSRLTIDRSGFADLFTQTNFKRYTNLSMFPGFCRAFGQVNSPYNTQL